MAQKKIRKFTLDTLCRQQKSTSRAAQVVKYGHESAEALLDAFRTKKGKRKGGATDEEQDILRGMVITCGACIDSTLKQIFQDCLNELILGDPAVKEGLDKFVEKTLKKELSSDTTKLLAKALTSGNAQAYLSEQYLRDLTGSSLQSIDQLFAASNALGVGTSIVKRDQPTLKDAFIARNKMVHEMDMDFSAARRNRVQRGVDEMIDWSNCLLKVAEFTVKEVNTKLG